MPDWSLVTRAHVLAAMQECDRLERREFLRRYGFTRARAFTLWNSGEEYDSQAILGVAYRQATGTPATVNDFPEGEETAAKVLLELGFDVVAEEQPVTAVRPRKVAPAKTRKVAEAPVKVCQRCYTALPATGVCDFCD